MKIWVFVRLNIDGIGGRNKVNVVDILAWRREGGGLLEDGVEFEQKVFNGENRMNRVRGWFGLGHV